MATEELLIREMAKGGQSPTVMVHRHDVSCLTTTTDRVSEQGIVGWQPVRDGDHQI